MSSAVLDASALLAVLHGERGFERVTPHLRGGLVSAVNYSEVLKKMVERGSDVVRTRMHLAAFNLQIVAFDELQAVKAAEIWPECRACGLSAADRACLTLGMMRQLPVVTADLRMLDADVDVEIEMIRKHSKRKGA